MEITICGKCNEGTGWEEIGTQASNAEVPQVCECCGGEFWTLVVVETDPARPAPVDETTGKG